MKKKMLLGSFVTLVVVAVASAATSVEDGLNFVTDNLVNVVGIGMLGSATLVIATVMTIESIRYGGGWLNKTFSRFMRD